MWFILIYYIVEQFKTIGVVIIRLIAFKIFDDQNELIIIILKKRKKYSKSYVKIIIIHLDQKERFSQ